jgi:N-acetylmuramoyl-L-alanine amidase
MTAPVTHKLFMLSNPERLVMDIDNAHLKASITKLEALNDKLKDSPIKRIRTARRGKHDLRIVLDLNRAVRPKSMPLLPNGQYGNRLMIDLYNKNVKEAPITEAKTIEATKNKKRNLIVVLDPGHGGEDPGASGPHHAKEKTVVLAIAKDLKRILNKKKGITVKLTRTGDYYIPLRERIRIAKSYKADLMVSIHADSFVDKNAQGASVYALSLRGSTSEAARLMANRENSADLITGGFNIKDKSDTLAGVLIDLAQTGSLRSSLRLGRKVLDSIDEFARLHKRRVEQAAFVVLKSPSIPSILIETGFISNPIESRRLTSAVYQRKMAKAIERGILNYFDTYPVQGTLMAWEKEQKNKKVVVASLKQDEPLH